jgi:hypothetical protein
MKIKHLIILAALIIVAGNLSAQEEQYVVQTQTGDLYGTIMLPVGIKSNIPVVLLISGSGPTDMNGNQNGEGSNCMKQLAEELSKKGIASCRFDKRGVAQSAEALKSELDIRFNTYVEDVGQWVNLLSLDTRFTKVIIAGHSEGSLIGMLACENYPDVKAFISLEGAGRPADEILKEQLKDASKEAKEYMYNAIDSLKKGDTTRHVPPIYNALFRHSIQPYMISWFRYNPQVEIGKLNIPILIVQGTTDIQVSVTDGNLLHTAQPKAEVAMIPNMNHVLKDCADMDKEKQKPIYSNPDLPLNKEMVNQVVKFIKGGQ